MTLPDWARGGTGAALVVMLTGALCLALQPTAPWLIAFPAGWTLPATQWVGAALDVFLNAIKPAMRVFSALLAYPMGWANAVLAGLPWPVIIGGVTAIGWHIGGRRMAALGAGGFGFVLLSGYWVQSMNTLALVAVSVPLAVLAGGAMGVLANELPRLRAALIAVLDAMQTIPTFAYLTPLLLLFGFGPVVGLIASAIYAAPPMARNVILGLERVEPDVKEAAVMSGANRLQQLFLVEIPAAGQQIMVGVNQCLMASLSMVIIASVIGGFNDIGWEVLLTMRKALFGQAFLAGLVIVVFAVVIDRMSAALALERQRQDPRVSLGLLGLGIAIGLGLLVSGHGTAPAGVFAGTAEAVDSALGDFTARHGEALNAAKTNAMFYGLLPLRIGLDEAVLPFTWGFQWTQAMSLWLFALAAFAGLALAMTGRALAGTVLVIVSGILETGIAQLPWPFVLVGVAALAWQAQGPRLAALCVVLLGTILVSGLWDRALLSLYLSGASVAACALVGGGLGLLAAVSEIAWRVLRPICDMLQTIPLFVFLIPVLMFFQIGEFSAFLAICAYAVVPMIRYTRHGLVSTPPDMIEAATASGATTWQTLRDVRLPYAAPSILLGLNQTILYAFAMLVIAALIGTTDLGQSIFLALGQADVGLGVSAGAAMAILAFIADRLVQGFAEERRRALGL
ncbi:ABC transporter permease subunit [Thalassococcus sp. CAU 1522]|uniref:ABC transporter permease subunit n=1 Tax=Thalassococcus arenae TaxID=2851652 RepID=A0ABS6NC62_9RHOB|nr:ABC transporter permease subunit [Thalassococcus arenae]MBV2361615.1 ABC transporter permease subunit [Thalassococcus arenae]